MGPKFRKFLRDWHRDIGYFFTGAILIYAISGLAINHIRDWNPNYSVEVVEKQVNIPSDYKKIDKDIVNKLLNSFDITQDDVKKYYFPSKNKLKIFLKNGDIVVNLTEQKAKIEFLHKRYIIAECNYLHYNPVKLWTYYSDVFAVSLIFLALSGLFILKGKYGFSKRGWWLVVLGMVVPVLVLVMYYY